MSTQEDPNVTPDPVRPDPDQPINPTVPDEDDDEKDA